MLKRLLFICLLMYSATMGFNTANVKAAEPTETTLPTILASNTTSDTQTAVDKSNMDETSIDQPSETPTQPANQSEVPDKGTGTLSGVAETASGVVLKQDQSLDKKVNQDQNVTGGLDPEQNQTVDVKDCQQQTNLSSSTCQDGNTIIPDGVEGQSQIASIEAAQLQNGDSTANLNAQETQGTRIIASQKLEVTDPVGVTEVHNQGTNIVTGQAQSILAELNADFHQSQKIMVNNSQDLLLGASGNHVDVDKQVTNIEGFQLQFLQTPGSATMEQTQTIEVKGSMTNPADEIGVTVALKNSIQIIKDTAGTAVKFIREIFVNNKLADRFTKDYTADENVPNLSWQDYKMDYEWGSLLVKNSATVFYSDLIEDIQATLSSSMSLVFNIIGTDTVPEPPADNNVDPPAAPPQNTDQSPNGSSEGTQQPQTIPNIVQVSANTGNNIQTATAPITNNEIHITASAGNTLPNTATNSYNLLVFGVLLITAGLVVFVLRRRNID